MVTGMLRVIHTLGMIRMCAIWGRNFRSVARTQNNGEALICLHGHEALRSPCAKEQGQQCEEGYRRAGSQEPEKNRFAGHDADDGAILLRLRNGQRKADENG